MIGGYAECFSVPCVWFPVIAQRLSVPCMLYSGKVNIVTSPRHDRGQHLSWHALLVFNDEIRDPNRKMKLGVSDTAHDGKETSSIPDITRAVPSPTRVKQVFPQPSVSNAAVRSFEHHVNLDSEKLMLSRVCMFHSASPSSRRRKFGFKTEFIANIGH